MKKRIIYILISILLAGLIIFGTAAAKNTIIIDYGIAMYKKMRLLSYVVSAVLVGWSVIRFVFCLVSEKSNQKDIKEKNAEEKRIKDEEERERLESEQNLSVKKDLDSAEIQKILEKCAFGEWGGARMELLRMRNYLSDMDKKQAKLDRLIVANGAESLSDTKDVLDDAEQYMCKRARKVINYMNVGNPSDPETMDKVLTKTDECNEECRKLLENTDSFLFALADFLNSQGDDENEIEMLNTYKNTILESIR